LIREEVKTIESTNSEREFISRNSLEYGEERGKGGDSWVQLQGKKSQINVNSS